MFSKIFIASLLATAALASNVKCLVPHGFDAATDVPLLAAGTFPDSRLKRMDRPEDDVKQMIETVFQMDDHTSITATQSLDAIKKCNGDEQKLKKHLKMCAAWTIANAPTANAPTGAAPTANAPTGAAPTAAAPAIHPGGYVDGVRQLKAQLEKQIADNKVQLTAARNAMNTDLTTELRREIDTQEKDLKIYNDVLSHPMETFEALTEKLEKAKRAYFTVEKKLDSRLLNASDKKSIAKVTKYQKSAGRHKAEKLLLQKQQTRARQVVNEIKSSKIRAEKAELLESLDGLDSDIRQGALNDFEMKHGYGLRVAHERAMKKASKPSVLERLICYKE